MDIQEITSDRRSGIESSDESVIDENLRLRRLRRTESETVVL